jgi:hypothetical protein
MSLYPISHRTILISHRNMPIPHCTIAIRRKIECRGAPYNSCIKCKPVELVNFIIYSWGQLVTMQKSTPLQNAKASTHGK